MMKRLIVALLLAAALLSLVGCGQDKNSPEPAETAVPTPEATVAPAPEATPVPETAAPAPSAPAPETGSPAAEEPAAPGPREIAESLVDRDVSELFEAIGEPVSSDYAPSCLGPGEDGELIYDGFTVYTYRENGVETVRVVD